ncbi:MAG: aquaporin [Candidatus Saccharimonadales bacterium]
MLVTRRRVAMLTAEFIGAGLITTIVLTLGKAQDSATYFIALGVGLTIAALILTVGMISGAHFNPAISLGLWTVRRSSALRTVSYIAAQLLGAAGAYWLFTYLFDAQLVNTGSFDPRILMAETFGTMLLAIGVAAAVFNNYKGGKTAATVGVTIAVGIMVASIASAGLLNPAVALGVGSWVWGTYVLGPVLGAIIGFNLYALLFAPTKEVVKIKE